MSIAEIIDDFPELTETDVKACLEFAADREHRLVAAVSAAWNYYSIKTSVENWWVAWLIFFPMLAMYNFMS